MAEFDGIDEPTVDDAYHVYQSYFIYVEAGDDDDARDVIIEGLSEQIFYLPH